MKEFPIIFSSQMVRAILDGRKTQTRRVMKPQPPEWARYPQEGGNVGEWELTDRDVDTDDLMHWPSWEHGIKCPYGTAGSTLWVRETFSYEHDFESPRFRVPGCSPIWYWADGNPYLGDWTRPRPSIHMPRWASRITLRIKSVRVERLQSISAEDALAEGVNVHPDHHDKPSTSRYSPVAAFRDLWDGLNVKRGYGWDANPFVWRIEFERVEPKP